MNPDLLRLLQACKDEPDVLTNRLILADWLEDHYDEPRAWFVRRQCGVLLGAGVLSETALLERHRETWTTGLEGTWSRGFFEWAFTPKTFAKEIIDPSHEPVWPWIASLWVQLKGVRSKISVLATFLAQLSQSPLANVSSLNFYEANLQSEGLKTLLKSEILPALRVLLLPRNSLVPQDATDIANTQKLHALTTLSLSENSIGPGAISDLAHSPHLQSLQGLYLRQTRTDDFAALDLIESPFLKQLIHLDLRHNPLSPMILERLHQRFGEAVLV